jgi:hypothetical protein
MPTENVIDEAVHMYIICYCNYNMTQCSALFLQYPDNIFMLLYYFFSIVIILYILI